MRTEKRTQEIAEELFEMVSGQVPSFFNPRRWKGRLMEWSMKDESFKVQLFRFVDLIPTVKSDKELLKVFTEYFYYGGKDLLPSPIKRLIPQRGVQATIAAKIIKANVKSLAKQFIAGSTPEQAAAELKKLRSSKKAFTVDLLGEAVLSLGEASLYETRYMDMINTLGNLIENFDEDQLLDREPGGAIPRGDLSLKVSSFYPRINPMDFRGSIEGIKKPLTKIIKSACANDLSLTFDMEHYQLKNLTLEAFKNIVESIPEFDFPGIALQSYLRDSEKDLRSLIAWAKERRRKISVRLVKGAYWDYEKIVNTQNFSKLPVFKSKAETDRNFEKLTRILLENAEYVRPAIASHNIRSIAHAMAVMEELGLKKTAAEFQALYGMAEPIKNAVTVLDYRLREYVPVGEFLPGMAYLVRRLLENTSNESFLRQSFVDKTKIQNLITLPPEKKEKDDIDIMMKEKFSNTPLTDFSLEKERESFLSSINKAKEKFKNPATFPLLIGGKEIMSQKTFTSTDPAQPQRIIGIMSEGSADDARAAITHAESAGKKWAAVHYDDRAEILFKAAEYLTGIRQEVAATEVFEVGKSWAEADGDVAEAIDFLNFYGSEIKRLGPPRRLGTLPGELNYSSYIPRGVVAVIAPWNFPLAISCGMTAAALAAGNSVMLKPSSLSPVTAYYITDAFREAGLPPGVLQLITGPGGTVGKALVESSLTDAVAFTGSMEVGLGIIRSAGAVEVGQKNVKKVIAEMGGKNAIIVDGTADMDEAIKGVVSSFLGYQGQKCSACSRLILTGEDEYKNEFLKRLSEAVASLTMGHPSEPGNIIGPIIDEGALKKIKNYIEIGKKEATLHYEFSPVTKDGNFVGPVIFKDVTPEMSIAKEEIFGPVLSVMEASDIDEAIEIANRATFALTGGIYSRSPANIDKVREGLEAGNVYINRKITGALVYRQPFGGFKMSGVGTKAGGRDYLQHFMFPRVVTENTIRRGFAPEE